HRQGIIRGVPLDLSKEEIIKEIISPFEISYVRRLNRKASNSNNSSEVNYVPSKTVAITFKGQVFPKYLHLFWVRYEVHPFVAKVPSCSSCLRLGHSYIQCKSSALCSHCGENRHADNIQCPKSNLIPICANCRGPHKPSDSSCPELFKQKQIRELAAQRNIPFIEAK
ncbi:hypothetical protein EAG_06560, partial [Camponotus floridanus]